MTEKQQPQIPQFDSMVELYKKDPEAFERVRADLLRQALCDAPAEYRLSLEALVEKLASGAHRKENARLAEMKELEQKLEQKLASARTVRPATAPTREQVARMAGMITEAVTRLRSANEELGYAVARLQAAALLRRCSQRAKAQLEAQARR